jgi:hypothetical protein
MSDNNGWTGKPGVPLNPEKTGWHWVGGIPYWWQVFDDDYAPLWQAQHLYFTAEEWSHKKYGGPCLTPAEVDARVKEARRDAREEAARLAEQTAAVLSNPSAKDSLNYVANAIRALKDEGNE